ncbi:FAM86A protein [Coniochaeta sp. PMI_546]|nr:FAM86A protein [Coniochaeta sp. PMI_546]
MGSSGLPSDQLTRFCRQYLQLERTLRYPDDTFLRDDQAQAFLYERLFKPGAVSHPPPIRYQLKVLKELVSRIESCISDWEAFGISEDLVTALAELLSVPLPSELIAAQQKCYVTYHQSLLDPDSSGEDPRITLLESRFLVSAAGTTGLRTWEASLHLGQYLCANPAITRGRRILELGAGTGYLSILCAKYLGAEHVVASDGSDDVIGNLPDSLFLNGLQGSDMVLPMDLKWGHALVGSEEREWNGGRKVDVVIGADITYDLDLIPALVGTLQELSNLFPNVEMVIAATERNQKTFESFLATCQRVGYEVNHVDFPIAKREEQMGPFYEDWPPIHLCKLVRRTLHDEGSSSSLTNNASSLLMG